MNIHNKAIVYTFYHNYSIKLFTIIYSKINNIIIAVCVVFASVIIILVIFIFIIRNKNNKQNTEELQTNDFEHNNVKIIGEYVYRLQDIEDDPFAEDFNDNFVLEIKNMIVVFHLYLHQQILLYIVRLKLQFQEKDVVY